jgi:hypothetical protein
MPKFKSALIERAIQVDELGPLVPRPLAAKFGFVSTRTLKNNEWPKGPLNPIKRNARSVSYRKEELLEFFGLTEPTAKRRPARKGRMAA